jgi:aspartate-semialdehyde dehydrogenase
LRLPHHFHLFFGITIVIERINVATYQAVSGSGKEAISELIEQTTKLLSGNTEVDVKVYPKQIAFNDHHLHAYPSL